MFGESLLWGTSRGSFACPPPSTRMFTLSSKEFRKSACNVGYLLSRFRVSISGRKLEDISKNQKAEMLSIIFDHLFLFRNRRIRAIRIRIPKDGMGRIM